MDREEVEIEISADGKVSVRTIGIKGARCIDVAEAIAKIVEGRVNGYVKASVLLDQPWVKDGKVTIRALLDQAGAALGEKIEVGRFARFNIRQS